jgi:hypothetical protein
MTTPRRFHTATLLDGGHVLVAGGINNAHSAGLETAEVYDPANDAWSSTGSMATSRETEDGPRHEQVLLANREVLAVGGSARAGTLAAAERYHDATGTWSGASSTHIAREQGHTLTPLNYGKILLVGGRGEAGTIAVAELYDPVTNAWSVIARPGKPRLSHTATSLSDGRVLLAGGRGANLEVLGSAEVFASRAQRCPPATPAGDKAATQTDGKATTQGGDKSPTQSRDKAIAYGDRNPTESSDKATTSGEKQPREGNEKPPTQVRKVPIGGVETGGGDARWKPGRLIGELAETAAPRQQVRRS